MTPPNTFGDAPVHDPVTTNQLLIGIHARLDGQDKVLDDIVRFLKGDGADGKNGALSRLNSHSKDIGEVKDELTWVRRGVIAALCGIVIAVAGWGLSKVADGSAHAQPAHK